MSAGGGGGFDLGDLAGLSEEDAGLGLADLAAGFVTIYGAEHAQKLLADGWSNGYTSTRTV